jgi:Rho-related BTB domain-containing protein 1/2
MWYPEIRRFCPQTPVILVGCKNDLRYMYRDETYLSYVGDRSPFVRAPRKSDIVMPDEARAVAKELGVAYYETSVFTYFGVNEVFENAIRAALIARRQQRFWMTNLKRVQRPILQAPFRPPKPLPPEVTVIAGTHTKDLLNMLNSQCYTDLMLIVGTVRFPVHRFMVASSSNAFHRQVQKVPVAILAVDSNEKFLLSRLLTMDIADMGARSSSESSMVSSTFGESTTADFNEDTECLIRLDPAKPPSNR